MDTRKYSAFVRKYNNKKINILGVNYTIVVRRTENDPELKHGDCDGYCSYNTRLICIKDHRSAAHCEYKPIDWITNDFKEILRHEIFHAFLNESGLNYSSFTCQGPWATNEEMVDWLAIQSPKIFELFA